MGFKKKLKKMKYNTEMSGLQGYGQNKSDYTTNSSTGGMSTKMIKKMYSTRKTTNTKRQQRN